MKGESMLELKIPDKELFDENKQEFVTIKGTTLSLEHSLVSISKWESKWRKPFYGDTTKTTEETIDYIKCMTITQNVKPEVYAYIPGFLISTITAYINEPMTASWINDSSKSKNKEVVTSELIYYWMIANNIPAEYQKWHLNRLLMLIRVCNEKNNPPKKLSKKEMIANRNKLNEERKQKYNSKG